MKLLIKNLGEKQRDDKDDDENEENEDD